MHQPLIERTYGSGGTKVALSDMAGTGKRAKGVVRAHVLVRSTRTLGRTPKVSRLYLGSKRPSQIAAERERVQVTVTAAASCVGAVSLLSERGPGAVRRGVFTCTPAMRLLQSADLHVDSPMRGLVAYDNAPVDELRLATRVALSNLVDAAIERAVDGVLLAGDIFDGDWPHYGTGVHFVSEMARLREAEIPVVMVAGNHDAASKLTRSLRFPDNVRVLGTRKPETVLFENVGLAVHGQGYATPALLDDLSAGYPAPLSDLVNVGLLHTSVDGRPGHERYAPCTVEGLVARGYAFWGLGHVHSHEVLSLDPLIVFPGNLQGRGVREAGPKGAVIVEIGEDGRTSLEQVALDAVRWAVLTIDASDCADRDQVIEHVAAAIRNAVGNAGERLVAARVVISGVSDAHNELAGDEERLRYEVIGGAVDVAATQVWIEQVRLETRAPRDLAAGDDAIGELVQELADLMGEEGSSAELAATLEPLKRVLPPAVLAEFDPSNRETIRELMADVSRSLPVALLERTDR